MTVKILNWGGVCGWFFRKYASFLTSAIMLKSADILYRKDISIYVREFVKLEREGQAPVFRILKDLNIIDKARILREKLGKHVEISMITNGSCLPKKS